MSNNSDSSISANEIIGSDELIFADEISFSEDQPALSAVPWKILVADDEDEVHGISSIVLRDIIFEDAPIEIISVYSAEEVLDVLRDQPDVAVILLDVVMEKDTAGLDIVRKIRYDLKNRITRIIIRTGQPGVAPERSVILDYDINDYREKTELTAKKLYTAVISALRNYRDMKLLETSRNSLKKIVDSSAQIFSHQSLNSFLQNVLNQLFSILNIDKGNYGVAGGFVAVETENGFDVPAVIGIYEDGVDEEVINEIQSKINAADKEKELVFYDNSFMGYFKTKHSEKSFIYVKETGRISDIEKDIIRVFCNNIHIAYENIYLNIDIVDAQKEIILRMGDVVETRSKETANHVYRVAEYSYLLALKAGLSEEKAQVLRHASPMHDVGKVGVSDSILLKSGKYTAEEFSAMQRHTILGYNIFSESPREIIQAAGIIAYEHHERWDGKGYPRGLTGDEIHIYGRITSLADVFDALINSRSYKKAWSADKVFEFILENRGTMFDPVLVDLFLENREEILEIKSLFPDTD